MNGRVVVVMSLWAIISPAPVSADEAVRMHHDAPLWSPHPYEPKPFSTWEELPKPVQYRVVEQLKQRVGGEFYGNLKLTGGRIIDRQALFAMDPKFKDYHWEIPTYQLVMRFSRPDRGIEYYDVAIECRDDGTILRGIDLPNTAASPPVASFITAAEVFKIARDTGFDPTKWRAHLDYDRKAGRIVYFFTENIGRRGPVYIDRTMEISAHDGEVIRLEGTYAIE